MRKTIVSVLFVAFTTLYAQAQTKIFKEVNNEISSQMKAILQDNTLVGYLVFTQLEKISDDSFNYKISILDENLNDIGALNFSDKNMVLQDVSFEQDVLCVAYVKSKYAYKDVNISNKEYESLLQKKDDEVFIQYISLSGKIIKTNSFPVKISYANFLSGAFMSKSNTYSYLRHPVQIKSIAQKGFVCYFGDTSNYLVVLDIKGNVLWKRQLNDEKYGSINKTWTPGAVFMTTAGTEIYIISNKYEWGHFKPQSDMYNYELLGYSAIDTTKHLQYSLADEKLNQLRNFNFKNAPSTGKPYITGMIANPKNEKFIGLCAIDINGLATSDIHWVNSYWLDKPFDATAESQAFRKNIASFSPKYSFKDFDGHAYFANYNYSSGSELLAQDEKGLLSIESNILSEGGLHSRPLPFSHNDNNSRSFYTITSTDTKTTYLIVDDPQAVTIYNRGQKKVQRTIEHKDGDAKITVLPAKDGYMMVVEYNKKEKYTKLSIEVL